jgi:hypothetical protein
MHCLPSYHDLKKLISEKDIHEKFGLSEMGSFKTKSLNQKRSWVFEEAEKPYAFYQSDYGRKLYRN